VIYFAYGRRHSKVQQAAQAEQVPGRL